MHPSNYKLMLQHHKQIKTYLQDVLFFNDEEWNALKMTDQIELMEAAVKEKGLMKLINYPI